MRAVADPVLSPSIADNRGKRIGVLIVAYNALTTLAKVLDRIPQDVWDNVEEVVVFDDASQDRTYELALGYKTTKGTDKLHVLSHPANLGYGGNQKAGYRYFMERGFDAVVLLHGDGQYAPEILSHLYHPLVTGEADAVFGSRMMRDYGGPLKGGMPLYKYLGNRILTVLENHALNLNLTEFHSGYRAYSLAALKQMVLDEMTNDFHFDTEIIIKLHHQGFRIREVPIPTYYGGEICYVNGFRYAKDVVRAVHRYRRTVRSVECFPEFREFFIHYPIKESRHSSHTYFLNAAGSNQTILELGCGEGFFAERLAQRGNGVTGVDALDRPKHSEAMVKYVKADLSRGFGPAVDTLRGFRYDKILMMDVLEHLERPEQLLRECRSLMTEQTQALISVPNVANITVRVSMLFGQFRYTERGILDKTHLRFFTRRSARQMIESSGYDVTREDVTVMPLELVFGWRHDNPVMRVLNSLLYVATRVLPGLLGYQLIFHARRRQKA